MKTNTPDIYEVKDKILRELNIPESLTETHPCGALIIYGYTGSVNTYEILYKTGRMGYFSNFIVPIDSDSPILVIGLTSEGLETGNQYVRKYFKTA